MPCPLFILESVKVSKSQKHFFLKLHCPPKRTKYLTKVYPMKLMQNFIKYFVRFWEMEFQEKILLRFTDLQVGIFLSSPATSAMADTGLKSLLREYSCFYSNKVTEIVCTKFSILFLKTQIQNYKNAALGKTLPPCTGLSTFFSFYPVGCVSV